MCVIGERMVARIVREVIGVQIEEERELRVVVSERRVKKTSSWVELLDRATHVGVGFCSPKRREYTQPTTQRKAHQSHT